MRLTIFCLLASLLFSSVTRAQVPVFEVNPATSTVKFHVQASLAIDGVFRRWHATLTFASRDVTTGLLDIKIQADSVDAGSSIKNNTLKGKDFFDVQRNPLITFKSTQLVQTGPDNFEVDGNLTIRGVTKGEKLTLTVSGRGTGSGEIKGIMAIDRKDYGMNGSIPFLRIANRVEISVHLNVKRVSGPPPVFKQ
jgi:polyisoprenoid-binding protein YceI